MTIIKWFKRALVAVTGIGLVACSNQQQAKPTDTQSWSDIEKSGKITIGFDNTFAPMGFEDTSGKNVGFDIDLATAVFDSYGITIDWQAIDWDLKEKELNNGNIDLIWNGYSATDARREIVLFSNRYIASDQVLVTKKSSDITAISDMKGKILGTQAGSSGYQLFNDEPKVLKDLVADGDARQYATFNEALIDLKNDRIDGILIDQIYANYYLTQEGILKDYTILTPSYTGEAFAVGARKSDSLLVEKINKAFKELYDNGTFTKLSEKWFGADIATDEIKK